MKKVPLLALVAFFFVSCATTAPYNPFKIAKEEIYGKVERVALVPVVVPEDLEDPGSVKAEFDSLIEAKLREAGFSVVPSEAYSKIWEQAIEKVGGCFDPITGKPDKAKLKTVQEQCHHQVCTKFNADALLYPSIVLVKANFHYNRATWDGVEENIGPKGWKGFFAGDYQGAVGALSLKVALQDVHGAGMYLNRGGIQTLAKISGGQFVPVPQEELIANKERNNSAVEIALGPLARKSAEKESAK